MARKIALCVGINRYAFPQIRQLGGCVNGWDAPFEVGQQRVRHGAMSYNFAIAVLGACRNGKAITFREAHDAAQRGVRERFRQEPQLEGSDRLKDAPVFGYVPQ
jgi:hypothetical protein